MPRPMSGAMLAALQSSILYPAIFVEITFATGPVYVWSGIGTINWNGQNWLGVGTFGGVSVIEEGTDINARGITLTLSGIDQSMLADALQEMRLGLPVIVYLGLFSSAVSPLALIPDPLTSWSGRTDQPTIDVSGTAVTISLNAESRMLELNVPASRRYTIEDSQMDNPGDLGFQFVNAIQEITIQFGSGTSLTSTNV